MVLTLVCSVGLRKLTHCCNIMSLFLFLIQTKADYDKECKICTRPFTVFRWRPGRDARFKKSEVCQTCSKLKNVCQVCLLDLEYGLPVQVRDTALSINSNDAIPKSDVNREYFAEEHDRRVWFFTSSYGFSQLVFHKCSICTVAAEVSHSY